jgi:DNA repair exonuclease SbcCD nuclease subunit
MQKFIHCADIHLGSKMESKLSKDKADERRAEVRKTFLRMVE